MPMPDRKPECGDCGNALTCPDCSREKDPRPTADKLYPRCQVRSPLGRWETVTRVHRDGYGPFWVWTKEAGDDFAWHYAVWEKIDMVHPLPSSEGDPVPEVRVVEWAGADGHMYAIAIGTGRTYGLIPSMSATLVESRSVRGQGWWVAAAGTPGEQIKVEGLSKAQARSKVRALARAYAKQLGIKVNIVAAREW